ncbi:Hypothetical_protein [Hexamita inflata]|uniref:Hypothetical_protein n=1 Tax=Hexamita inflata TaxID=28002 RepID=A0AA86TZZ9_9EUKA|nr:Hypothetical protein HINF_LOCUS19562 [Hexamita inflata]CAI9933327.1 Hypothetical protein HINF_LOCUS20972 [Hexamita inflata]
MKKLPSINQQHIDRNSKSSDTQLHTKIKSKNRKIYDIKEIVELSQILPQQQNIKTHKNESKSSIMEQSFELIWDELSRVDVKFRSISINNGSREMSDIVIHQAQQQNKHENVDDIFALFEHI